MNIISIGIDNGLHGAVTAINQDLTIVGWWDCPTVLLKKGSAKSDFATAEMGKILQEIIGGQPLENTLLMAWIERAHPMPKQGLSSTFKTGRGYGLWEGICIGMQIKYDVVTAKEWQNEILKGMLGDTKSRSMTKCQCVFPEIPLTTPRGKKLTMDGRSDSALIAYYGLLKLQGRQGKPDETKQSKQRIERPTQL